MIQRARKNEACKLDLFLPSTIILDVGSGVSLLTSPATANLPEVASENFAREAQRAGV